MLRPLSRRNCFSGKNRSHKGIFMAQNYLVRDREETRRLRQSIAKARTLLEAAARRLHDVVQAEILMAEIPVEAGTAIESAAEGIAQAIRCLESTGSGKVPSATLPDGPTRQQGQFLAFICEYMMRNEAGVAPRHADLQRFFNLTAPSVNSMLIRLEQRGFIHRIPGKARAIQIVIQRDLIPKLDRPFKFSIR